MPRIDRLIASEVSSVVAVWASVAGQWSHDMRHQRRAAPRSVFASVEAFAAQGVDGDGDKHRAASIHMLIFKTLFCAKRGIKGAGYFGWPLFFSASTFNRAAIEVEVCSKATACSAA